MKFSLLRIFLLLSPVAIAACAHTAPPAALTSVVTDSGGIPIITLGRSLDDVAQGRAGGANDTATMLFELDSLEHPVAAAFRASGEVAILDRDEMKLTLLDSSGTILRTLGRRGDGPGEFHTPAGVAAVGTDLLVLQAWPANMLVAFPEAGPPDAVTPPISGDWNGWNWQRPDIALETTDQSGPEVWSRRLRALDDSTFLVFVGPIDEDTSANARSHLLRFRHDLKLLDTLATFPAERRDRRPNLDGKGGFSLFRAVWGEHPVWTAAGGSIVTGRSTMPRVEVRASAGKLGAVVRWTADSAPVTPEDRHALGMEIGRVSMSVYPNAAKAASKMSKGEIDAMVDQVMAGYELAPLRPELVGLFLADRCLWMAGFDANDSADGTAHEWLVLDLDHPTSAPKVVTIGGPTERVIAIERGKAATVRLDEDGFRRVRVYRVPSCRAST